MGRAAMTKSERAEKWTQRIREENLAEGAFSQESLQRTLDEESLTLFRSKSPLIEAHIETVIRRYLPYLSARALKLLGSVEAVEEVVQETWIDLYTEGIVGGRGWLYAPERYGWLTTVLYHNACDFLRRQRKTISLDTKEGLWLLEQRTDPFDRPDVPIMRVELTKEICNEAVRVLTPPQLIALTSFYVRGQSIELIAQSLGCSENTVKSHLRRARGRLKKAFEKCGIRLREIQAVGGLDEQLEEALTMVWSCMMDELKGTANHQVLR